MSKFFSSDNTVFIPQLHGYNKSKWTSRDISMKFSDFISNVWVTYIFLILILMLVCWSLLSANSFAIFSFWYWCWVNSLSSLHSADSFAIFCLWHWDWVASLFFLDSEDSFACFFLLFRCCWTNLFSLDSSLSFTVLLFSYSCLAINHFSFPSGVSVKDFHFLFIDCVCRFLLFLNSKCSIFGLSWTFCKSSSVSLTIKDTFNFKRNNPYL